MAGQVELKEVTRQEPKQDCGCGCGGDHCRAVWQELVLVGAAADRNANKSATQRCDGECGCRG